MLFQNRDQNSINQTKLIMGGRGNSGKHLLLQYGAKEGLLRFDLIIGNMFIKPSKFQQ